MRPQWAAPPAADPCLSRPYSSRANQKGGTIIAEGVVDLAAQQAAVAEPGRCRPPRCLHPDCGCERLHVHERRERRPRQFFAAGIPVPVVEVLIFICARCSATWRVLPRFLARCLWRSWDTVERAAVGDTRRPIEAPVPRRTVRRWRARLRQSARVPIQVLALAGARLRWLAERLGFHATRRELLLAHGEGLAVLGALLHRLAQGVRLM